MTSEYPTSPCSESDPLGRHYHPHAPHDYCRGPHWAKTWHCEGVPEPKEAPVPTNYPTCPVCGKDILPDHSRFKAWTTDENGNTNERGYVHLSHIPAPKSIPETLQAYIELGRHTTPSQAVLAKREQDAQQAVWDKERISVLETILDGIAYEMRGGFFQEALDWISETPENPNVIFENMAQVEAFVTANVMRTSRVRTLLRAAGFPVENESIRVHTAKPKAEVEEPREVDPNPPREIFPCEHCTGAIYAVGKTPNYPHGYAHTERGRDYRPGAGGHFAKREGLE